MLFDEGSKVMVSLRRVERGHHCRAPPEAKQEERVMSYFFLLSPEVTALTGTSSCLQFREFRKEHES